MNVKKYAGLIKLLTMLDEGKEVVYEGIGTIFHNNKQIKIDYIFENIEGMVIANSGEIFDVFKLNLMKIKNLNGLNKSHWL